MAMVISEEHEIVLNATGHLLVTGGPGSGKTTIALQKALKYIDENNLQSGQQVLFLSFSRAAVSRISQSADLVVSRDDFQDFLSIQTFHSFFWEIIKTHGYLLGIPKKLTIFSPHDEDSARQGRNKDDDTWLQERRDVLMTDGKICFDLFAETALSILRSSKTIRDLYTRKFPLIIIDEAQDTDAQQWECIRVFSGESQVILLADLDQQIHDYREDVTPERINDIIRELNPTQVALGNTNHRSGGTEIAIFARDVLNNIPRTTGYSGVSILKYPPRGSQRDLRIRQSVGILYQSIRTALGREPESIAILASWGHGVKIISNALRESNGRVEIPHRVQFDETATYLSSRVIACLLEPKQEANILLDIAEVLDLICNLYRSKGQRSEWEKYSRWASDLRRGTLPTRGTVVSEIKRIMETIATTSFTGDPEKDWLMIKSLLLASTNSGVAGIGKSAEYLMAFNRGRLISKGLSRQWEEKGSYKNARNILDMAIIETQIVSENKNQGGINVMTIHKAKGKEFDGVILFDNLHSCPFVARGDVDPLIKSRKLLLVGITRAKCQTIILQDVSQACPILNNFNL